jgi:hypothetical protein
MNMTAINPSVALFSPRIRLPNRLAAGVGYPRLRNDPDKLLSDEKSTTPSIAISARELLLLVEV